MTSLTAPQDRNAFEIAIVCALALEADCVLAIFDRNWQDEGKRYGKAPGDTNTYTTGAIGPHNVVLAYLPEVGGSSAASTATSISFSFPNVRLCLLVGICGAVPYNSEQAKDIYLGDVIISRHIVRYKFGKQYPDRFEVKEKVEDALGRPSGEIRGLLTKLDTDHYRQRLQIKTIEELVNLQQRQPKTRLKDSCQDFLFESSHLHKHHDLRPTHVCPICRADDAQVCTASSKMTCHQLGCDKSRVQRTRPNVDQATKVSVHVGRMGSADEVMKSGQQRDQTAKNNNLIAFEMESSGVPDRIPTIVIKGVSDYADSHKNDEWQHYAAATAAACTKALLTEWDRSFINQTHDNIERKRYWAVPVGRLKTFIGREEELRYIQEHFSKPSIGEPLKLALQAMGGQGKSQVALRYCVLSRKSYRGTFWANASSKSTLTQSFVRFGKLVDNTLASRPDEEVLQSFLEALESWAERWLIVFDNYDDPETFETIERFFPTGEGNILITTRHRGLQELTNILEIPPLSQNKAVELLLSIYQGVEVDQYMSIGIQIVERLGCLALAIHQASAWLRYRAIPVQKLADFLTAYDEKRKEVLQFVPATFWQYRKSDAEGALGKEKALSAFTTWEMSFQQLCDDEDHGRDAAEGLLLTAAFLGSTNISEHYFATRCRWRKDYPGWLSEYVSYKVPEKFGFAPQSAASRLRKPTIPKLDRWLKSLAKHPAMAEILEILRFLEDESETVRCRQPREATAEAGSQMWNDRPRYELNENVHWNHDGFWNLVHRAFSLSLLHSVSRTDHVEFTLHSVIKDWLQLRSSPSECQYWVRECTVMVACYLKNLSLMSEHVDDSAETHIRACLGNDEAFFEAGAHLGQQPCTARECVIMFDHFALQYDHRLGRGLMESIVGMLTKYLGEGSLFTTRYLQNLLVVSKFQDVEQAESIARKLYELKKRKSEDRGLVILNGAVDLIDILLLCDKYEDIEVVMVEANSIYEGLEDKENDTVRQFIYYRAMHLERRRQYRNAEALLRRVLTPKAKSLNPLPLFVRLCLMKLLAILGESKRFFEARQLIAEMDSLTIARTIPELIWLYEVKMNLAQHEQKYDEAIRICEYMLIVHKERYGMRGCSTIRITFVLANLLRQAGRLERAEDLFSATITNLDKLHGPGNPVTEAVTKIRRNEHEQIRVKAMTPAPSPASPTQKQQK